MFVFIKYFVLLHTQPYESMSQTSSLRDPKSIRRDSRPNTPISQGGPIENGHGQYP